LEEKGGTSRCCDRESESVDSYIHVCSRSIEKCAFLSHLLRFTFTHFSLARNLFGRCVCQSSTGAHGDARQASFPGRMIAMRVATF
jgi:hypothetical protein